MWYIILYSKHTKEETLKMRKILLKGIESCREMVNKEENFSFFFFALVLGCHFTRG